MLRRVVLLSLLFAGWVRAAAVPTVLLVAGAPSHGPGEHRFPDGVRVLAQALNESGLPLHAEVSQGWPDAAALSQAGALVIYSDGLGSHVAEGHVADLRAHVAAGRGLVVLHFAVEPSPGELADFLLASLGGRFEVNWSVNPVWTPAPVTLATHEITRGVTPFSVEDEWYYHLRFQPDVVPLLQAVPPAKSLGADGPRSGNPAVRAAVAAGEPQTLAWAFEHAGARAFGFTGGHFHRNWAEPNFRRLVLNAIAWSARVPVPAGGVESSVAPIPRYATLDEAIARGDVADVRVHLQLEPASVNTPGKSGLLPLHNAILRNRAAVAAVLLEAGAAVDAPDKTRRTPLHLAVERGNADLVRALGQRHAKPNELDAQGWTPLHHAAAQNQVAVAQALLAAGADVKVLSERGGTALHEAAASGGSEMVQLLLAAGTDPKIVSKTGVTALDIAREYKNESAIAALTAAATAKP